MLRWLVTLYSIYTYARQQVLKSVSLLSDFTSAQRTGVPAGQPLFYALWVEAMSAIQADHCSFLAQIIYTAVNRLLAY